MKTISTIAQVLIVVFGIAVFAFMLWEPNVEGRNVNATLFEIYFTDPLLAFAYVASLPFFMGLFQAFKIFGNLGNNQFYIDDTVRALRKIKSYSLLLIGFVMIGEIFILLGESDDRIPGIGIGVLITLFSVIVFAIARAFELRILKRLA